jgi:tetratricopeptide (TPR) repeat protein
MKFALAFLLGGILLAQGPDQWMAVSNSHFEIYSQAGGEAPYKALVWFEHLRAFFTQGDFLPEIARPADLPVLRVIGFRSQQEYAQFQLRFAADAYYAGTTHRDYIVMPSLEPRHFAMAAHEYSHFVFHASGLKLPDWLAEGLAEYFSTLQFSASGYELGGDLPARTQTLERAQWIPLPEFLDFTFESTARQGRQDFDRFYAQSWALADMLMTSPGYRGRLAGLIAALSSGTSSRQAFAEVYGKSLDVVTRDLSNWFARKRTTLVVQAKLPEPPDISSFTLSGNQTMALLADLLVATGKLDRARARYAEIARQTPHDPAIHAALGSIAFSKGEREEALREWRQALDDGLTDADLCFRYALAAEDAGAPQSDIRAALGRAVALRPSFDDARFRLALLENNAGDYRAAIDQLQAMRVPHGPRAYGYWAALAYAFTELDQRDQAVAAAGKALSEAKTEEDRESARRIAHFASTDLKVQFIQDSEGRLHDHDASGARRRRLEPFC